MNKAFIFDMDGVLIDSEPVWEQLEQQHLPHMFGKETAEKIGMIPGIGLAGLMDRAEKMGATFDRSKVSEQFEEIAKKVYDRSPLTKNAGTLIETLASSGFKVGVVTQSAKSWISHVLPRMPFTDRFDIILSIHDHPDMKLKPEPDGYLYAFKALNADPARSFVLEDSNVGIKAGKASGACVIGYRGNLLPGYVQEGANVYADTMDEVITLVEQFDKSDLSRQV